MTELLFETFTTHKLISFSLLLQKMYTILIRDITATKICRQTDIKIISSLLKNKNDVNILI